MLRYMDFVIALFSCDFCVGKVKRIQIARFLFSSLASPRDSKFGRVIFTWNDMTYMPLFTGKFCWHFLILKSTHPNHSPPFYFPFFHWSYLTCFTAIQNSPYLESIIPNEGVIVSGVQEGAEWKECCRSEILNKWFEVSNEHVFVCISEAPDIYSILPLSSAVPNQSTTILYITIPHLLSISILLKVEPQGSYQRDMYFHQWVCIVLLQFIIVWDLLKKIYPFVLMSIRGRENEVQNCLVLMMKSIMEIVELVGIRKGICKSKNLNMGNVSICKNSVAV